MASSFPSPAPPSMAPPTERAVRDPGAEIRVERPLGRRPSLPGGRALIGAALVVAAAVMTFAAYLGVSAAPGKTYVVASGPLSPNHRIGRSDLDMVTADLPDAVAGQVFTSPDELVGAVVLAPLAANDLVMRSAVLTADDPSAPSDAYEVSFTAPSWKLGGDDRLRPGELIDLVPLTESTDGSRSAASPVRDVRVLAVTDSQGDALGGSASADRIVTVAASDPAAYAAIVAAVRDEFYVIRSTRAAGAAPAPNAPVWGATPSAQSTTTAAASRAPAGTASSTGRSGAGGDLAGDGAGTTAPRR